MKQINFKIFILATFLWVMPWSVFGASINFEPNSVSVPQQGSYTVTIIMDTEGESLNAVDGTVLLADQLGNDFTITDSASVVTYWVERPTWDPNTRSIKFSGAIPGGFNGQNGILFSIVLPPYSGSKLNNAITVTDVHSYINDGLGTPQKISGNQFELGLVTDPVDPSITDQLYIDNKRADSIPPEMFSPQISKEETAYDGKWFISFATTDKQSGIDHYELQESVSGRIDSGNWKTVSSPYILEDQELHSFVFITAIDRQGNERVIKVFPKNDSPWWFRYGNDVLILAGIIVIILAGYWYYKREHSKLNVETKV